MNFKATPKTFQTILEAQRKYIIPRYQREYSWDKDEQVFEFWNDILKQIKVDTNSNFETSNYFIGSLVLIGDDSTDTDFLVIDGQQRITTITILLSALTQCAHSLYEKTANEDYDDFSKTCYRYIEGRDGNNKPFFKLQNETPKPFFQENILNITQLTERPYSEEEKRLYEAYDFFRQQINYELEIGKGKGNKILFLQAIRDQVIKCQTIYITVDNKENAQKVFETLNTKGKDLENIDLIKNKIFEILPDEHPNDLAKKYWDEIKEILRSREGENIKLSTFFYHFWISRYHSIAEHKIYDDFIEKVPQEKESYLSFLKELKISAEKYIMLVSPINIDWKQQEEKEIYFLLNSLGIFKISVPRTLLMNVLIKYEEKLIKLKDVIKFISKIVSFHLIFTAITSSRASGLERSYSKSARDLYKAKTQKECNNVINVFSKKLAEKIEEISLESFKIKFSNLKYAKGLTKDKKLIQYLFILNERMLHTTSELDVNSFTLEHIHPQSSLNSSKDEWIYKIGNLLPLAKELNQECDTKPFQEKISHFKRSELKQVKNFCDDNENKMVWNEQSVNVRTEHLAETIYNYAKKILKTRGNNHQ